MNNTSPNLTEIGLIIISSLAIIGAVILLILGKIDYAGCAGLMGAALALWGANTLYKAPSPAQQAQLGAQQETLQQTATQALALLSTFATSLHTHLPEPVLMQAPVAPPQTAAPLQSSVVPGVTLTPTPPNSSAIVTESIPPTGTFTTVQQVSPAQTRDAWSNSALMQAIGKPTQQQ